MCVQGRGRGVCAGCGGRGAQCTGGVVQGPGGGEGERREGKCALPLSWVFGRFEGGDSLLPVCVRALVLMHARTYLLVSCATLRCAVPCWAVGAVPAGELVRRGARW